MSTAEEVLKRIYDAFNARDIDAVLVALHPDVDWPNGWEGGRVTGHSALRDSGRGSGPSSIPTWNRCGSALTRQAEP